MKTQEDLDAEFKEYCKQTKLPITFWVVATVFIVSMLIYFGGYFASIQ